jgi:hypothetical protein
MAGLLGTPELRPDWTAEPAISTQATANDAQAPVQGTQAVDPQKQAGGDARTPEAAASSADICTERGGKDFAQGAEELFDRWMRF